MTLDEEMMLILGLDASACVRLSPYTGKWFVASKIEVGDGTLLSGITEHRENPHDAVSAFFERLTEVRSPSYLATTYQGQRREWRWNGVAFAETTRPEAMAL